MVYVITVTFLDAVATVHVLTASNIDVKLQEIRPVHFAWLSNRRLFLITCIGKFIFCFPPEIPRE